VGNSRALAFTLAFGLIGHCHSSFAFDPSHNRISTNSDCIGASNPDPNANAIVEDVFKKKPQELLQEHIINQDFLNDIRSAKYLVCHDVTWEVITLDRTPSLTIFDSDFLGLLGVEAQSLVLGQYLANDHAQLNSTDLHTSLMRYVLRQNLSSTVPKYSLAQLANELVGSKVDLGSYEARPNYQRQWQTLFLQSLYFLVFHEFCHIHAKDIERRKEIAKLPADTPENIAKRESMLVALENRADSCAIEVINRDESQFKGLRRRQLAL
jgi:hypothetical protein